MVGERYNSSNMNVPAFIEKAIVCWERKAIFAVLCYRVTLLDKLLSQPTRRHLCQSFQGDQTVKQSAFRVALRETMQWRWSLLMPASMALGNSVMDCGFFLVACDSMRA
jgi:hypothetical protein